MRKACQFTGTNNISCLVLQLVNPALAGRTSKDISELRRFSDRFKDIKSSEVSGYYFVFFNQQHCVEAKRFSDHLELRCQLCMALFESGELGTGLIFTKLLFI